MMINPEAIRQQLQRLPGLNMHEIYHVTTFRCYRQTRSGQTQTVIVEIKDGGPEAGDQRYSCVALTEEGHFATGNPAPSVDVALAIVHWGELDQEKVPERGPWSYWR